MVIYKKISNLFITSGKWLVVLSVFMASCLAEQKNELSTASDKEVKSILEAKTSEKIWFVTKLNQLPPENPREYRYGYAVFEPYLLSSGLCYTKMMSILLSNPKNIRSANLSNDPYELISNNYFAFNELDKNSVCKSLDFEDSYFYSPNLITSSTLYELRDFLKEITANPDIQKIFSYNEVDSYFIQKIEIAYSGLNNDFNYRVIMKDDRNRPMMALLIAQNQLAYLLINVIRVMD